MSDEVQVIIDGETITTTAQALAQAFCERKARPESIWFSSTIKYLERAYVKNAGGAYSPVFIVVTEQAPRMRTVSYQEGFDKSSAYHGANYNKATVSFPYIVNVFVFNVGSDGTISLNRAWPLSFYRPLPLSGFSDPLYVCNVPNVRIDPWNDSAAEAAIGWTCYHNASTSDTSIRPISKKGGMTGESDVSAVTRLVEKCLQYWMDSSFTGSAGAVTAWRETAKKVKGVSSMEEWAKNSAADPDFGVKTDWLPHPKNANLGDVIISIRQALVVLPHEGFDNGEDRVIAPNGDMSAKRLKAVVTNPVNVSKKLKYY